MRTVEKHLLEGHQKGLEAQQHRMQRQRPSGPNIRPLQLRMVGGIGVEHTFAARQGSGQSALMERLQDDEHGARLRELLHVKQMIRVAHLPLAMKPWTRVTTMGVTTQGFDAQIASVSMPGCSTEASIWPNPAARVTRRKPRSLGFSARAGSGAPHHQPAGRIVRPGH